MAKESYYAHGKLLLTGEYLVLDGANALAIPTKFGQRLTISPLQHSSLHQIEWKSYTHKDDIWLSTFFPKETKGEFEQRLFIILKALEEMSPEVFYEKNLAFNTFLEFPRQWGLGTSSTLISLLAQWAKVNPYTLLDKTFGGSGYDIACATSKKPIVYSIDDPENSPAVNLSTSWTKHAYFVYLNKKQNSREAIHYYKSLEKSPLNIERMNALTYSFVNCKDLDDAITLIDEHEHFLADLLKLPKVKDLYFSDFNGACKSLGAWGGDFILVLSALPEKEVQTYFKQKGLDTFFKYDDLIWKK